MIALMTFAAFEPGLVGKIKRIAAENELYAPDVPLFGDDLFDRSFFQTHREEFEAVYSLLADEWSRHVFRSVLAYKISGKPEYLYECETPKDEAYRRILTLGSRESYADLGAYDGDTVAEFLQVVQNRYHRVYAFEPNGKNFRKLSRFFQGVPDIRLFQNCVWNKREVLNFNAKAGRSSAIDPAAQATVQALPVDEAVSEPLTYMKFDVEGAEREALEGCRRQVETYMPKLAVSAYHRTCDLFAIPAQVLSYRPEYRVYLRHHPYVPAWDTLYYFVP
jgi:FkbM family methyltransferase